MLEQEMWEDGVESISDGDVFTHDGRPVHFRSLVKRRWGWPKKAAYMAADHLLELARSSGSPAVIWVSKKHRQRQQEELFEQIPDLLDALTHGLSRGAQREIFDAGHELRSITVRFRELLSDDGLSAGILHALAARLGTTVFDLRPAIHFNTGDRDLIFTVDAGGFDP